MSPIDSLHPQEYALAGVAVRTHPAAFWGVGAGFRLRPIMHVIIRFITPSPKPIPQAGVRASTDCPPVRDLTEWGLCDFTSVRSFDGIGEQ